MVFPQTPLDVQIELRVGGVWTDITSDVYTAEGIHIDRGRADEGQRVDPGKCTLTLNNRSGKYSPRNPVSPYYGLIGRNTPLRVSVRAGSQFLRLPGATGDHASTPHATALAITGDIDVRADCQLVNWLDAADGLHTTQIIGKLGGPTSDKAWFLGVRSNRLYFEWSPDGTSALGASSTVELSVPPSGRLAVRATLDVDNGAAGRTVTFYTAASGVAGPWTQLGDPVVQSGTTSIFNATAAAVWIGQATGVNMTNAAGRCMAAEIRNGIAGTVVANPVFTAQSIGATSFTDAAGRTWTLDGGTQITNRRTRFVGEVSAWPSRWDVSGKDIRVPVEAAGILRRYGQGAKALDSTLRRRIPSYAPLAYWPMEEGATATRAYSPIAGVQPLTLTRATWASASSLASSNPLPVLASVSGSLPMMLGRIPAPAGTLTSWSVNFIYRLDQGNTTMRTFLRILSTGTVAEWYIQQSSGSGSTVIGKDSDGTTVFTQAIGTGSNLYGDWLWVRLTAKQNGGNVDWGITWFNVGGSAGGFSSSFAGTVGRPTAVASPPDGYSSDLDGMALGHISAWPVDITAAYTGAIDAWAGETVGARLRRLAAEEAKPVTVFGDTSAEELVGAQRPETFLDLTEAAADVDGGILYERRDVLGLAYRDRRTLYNQPVTLALNYNTSGHVAPPLEPVDDDQQIRNDRTVQREGGASARAVLETGTLSIQDPPNGVGLYDDSLTLNVYSDDQAEPHAWWLLHLGTVDEARYPVLNINLAAAPSLIDAACELDCGDRLTIANPPAHQPPGPIDVLTQGYREVIGHPIDWDLQLNCTPASPWNVAVAGDTVSGRAGTAGSKLAAALTSTATTATVQTTSEPLWTTADVPFDITCGGEVMTVTAASSWLLDTFGRTVASGWGSADSGQTWTVTGTASEYSTNSTYAITTHPSTGIAHLTTIAAPSADADLYMDVAASALATGASLFTGPVVRESDNNNLYQARVEFTTSNTILLTIRKRVAGVETQLGSTYTSLLTHVAGTFYRVRFQVIGTVLKARIWAAGSGEPGVWHVETTDSSLTAAANLGTRSFRNTGNTNASAELRFDNIDLANPQTFTLTRSVNGIVKAQTAGTAVQLAHPAVVAL